MRSACFFIVFFALILLFSCKVVDALKKTGDGVEQFQKQVLPLDTAAMNISIGLLEGATTDSSKNNIDSLTKTLVDGLIDQLQLRLKELEVDTIGARMISGITKEIGTAGLSDTLNQLINSAFSDLRADLKVTVDSIFIDLSSTQNKERLSSIIGGILTKQNSDSLRAFINEGIAGISFSSLADSIRMNLLNDETQAALNNVIPSKIDSILNKTEGILDKLGKEGEGFIERNIWTLVASIASLMLLGTLLWLWRKNSKENKMNDVIMASINEMNQSESEVLKETIKKNAIQRGVESHLHKRLNDLGLIESTRNGKG